MAHSKFITMLGLVAAAAVCCFIYARRAVPPAPSSRAPNHDAVEKELASLRQEIAAVRQERAVVVTQSVPPAPTAVAPPEPPAEEPKSPLTQEEAFALKVMDLEAQARTEPRDPKWSPAAEQQMANAFGGGQVPGSKLVAVSCGSSLCRAEVEHESDTARRELASHISSLPPFDYGVYYVKDPSKNSTVLYVLRAGEDAIARVP